MGIDYFPIIFKNTLSCVIPRERSDRNREALPLGRDLGWNWHNPRLLSFIETFHAHPKGWE